MGYNLAVRSGLTAWPPPALALPGRVLLFLAADRLRHARVRAKTACFRRFGGIFDIVASMKVVTLSKLVLDFRFGMPYTNCGHRNGDFCLIANKLKAAYLYKTRRVLCPADRRLLVIRRNIMEDKIKKLPKWAQEYIRTLERDKAVALTNLQEWVNEQTPSPFFVEDYTGGKFHRRYFQTHKIDIEHNGMTVSVYLRDEYIDINFWAMKGGNVYIQPRATNNIYLVRV